jgi:hippurate hydrolase
MLLGAAKMLSETKAFDGTVYFIFQPGEEGCGGAMAMINDGLFKKFKIDCVFGMHAGGGFRTGEFSTRPGPLLAGNARFRIRIIGKEAHAASPHRGIDALIVGSQVVLALQTIVSRLNRPIDPVVISVVEFKSGNGSNVIPGEAILSGTIRTFGHKVMTNVTRDIAKIAKGISKIYGATADVEIVSGTSALVNSKNETGRAILAAQDVVGEQKVEVDGEQFMGSDDFACLLEKCPGCYIHLGNGVDSIGIHTPKYDFHDENLATGVKYWEALVKRVLPRK